MMVPFFNGSWSGKESDSDSVTTVMEDGEVSPIFFSIKIVFVYKCLMNDLGL